MPVDRRDEPTWVALELSRLGMQKIEEGLLDRLLRYDLKVDPDYPIFIPATTYLKGNRSVTIHLVEGYAFVAAGLPEVRYFALERRPYVDKVISTEGPVRTVSVIPDKDIQRLRQQLQAQLASDIQVGEHARITEGPYQRLDGLVTGIEGDSAFVFIKLRSLQVVATVPRIFLESLDSEVISSDAGADEDFLV